MRKIIIILTLCITAVFTMGCSKEKADLKVKSTSAAAEKNAANVDKENNSRVEGKQEDYKPIVKIKYNIDSFTIFDDNQTLVLNPEDKNIEKENVQYHWTISGGPALAFKVDSGCSNEVINSGEFVSIGIFSEVSYVDENSILNYKVDVKLEDKDTGEVIASSNIVIQDKAGKYSIQETE